ncbi:hypothetical protein [Chitinophaga sp. YIM B06452]|uniref:hypothetical protein n=1 Tax=Chitinophaga sp. YIM B06452 TaxID=3082158 RepID=UPI0031FF2AF1
MIMKIHPIYSCILPVFLAVLSACSQQKDEQQADAPLVAPEKILSSYNNLYYFRKDYLKFWPESYMDGLQIASYPTHIVANKKGNISKMTGRVGEAADALKTEVGGKGI